MIFSLAVVGHWDSSSMYSTVQYSPLRYRTIRAWAGGKRQSASLRLRLPPTFAGPRRLFHSSTFPLFPPLFHLFPLSSALAPPFYPLPFSLLPDACACACAYAHGGGCPLTYRGTGLALLYITYHTASLSSPPANHAHQDTSARRIRPSTEAHAVHAVHSRPGGKQLLPPASVLRRALHYNSLLPPVLPSFATALEYQYPTAYTNTSIKYQHQH